MRHHKDNPVSPLRLCHRPPSNFSDQDSGVDINKSGQQDESVPSSKSPIPPATLKPAQVPGDDESYDSFFDDDFSRERLHSVSTAHGTFHLQNSHEVQRISVALDSSSSEEDLHEEKDVDLPPEHQMSPDPVEPSTPIEPATSTMTDEQLVSCLNIV